MGCWDETCAVSGLAIKVGDPIRFALVSRTDELDITYPYDLYKLWTPMFEGVYDDYGFAEEIKQTELWEWWIEQFAGDADRFDRIDVRLPEVGEYLRAYICHKWAFDEVLSYAINIDENDDFSINDRVQKFLIKNRRRSEKQSSPEEEIRYFMDVVYPMSIDSIGHGYLFPGLHKILHSIPDDFTGEVLNLLIETSKFIYSLENIRKGVVPNLFFGAQCEENEYLSKWSKLVAEKAAEQKLEWDKALNDEDEYDN
jgi:hypothetical protein